VAHGLGGLPTFQPLKVLKHVDGTSALLWLDTVQGLTHLTIDLAVVRASDGLVLNTFRVNYAFIANLSSTNDSVNAPQELLTFGFTPQSEITVTATTINPDGTAGNTASYTLTVGTTVP
jgi:hypothetical protein